MKKIKIILQLMLSALFLTSCTPTNISDIVLGYRQITMDDAIRTMSNEIGYVILDVRTPEEYAAGHIPGAINVPNEIIGDYEIPELPKKDQLILVYCRSGRRSKEAAEKLVKLGYTNVSEFGGINDWTGEIAK